MENVRKSNNLIKRSLIEEVCVKKGMSVLDVGCGCGGDLSKWKSVGAKVDMCDPDSESLDEAARRAKNLKYKVNFIHGDIRACPKKKYDVICFNFSLHYIFQDYKTFSQNIWAIRERLTNGGVLMGCIPDAHYILPDFSDEMGNYMRPLDNKRIGFGNFGEFISVYLADTPFYNATGVRTEPLAYRDILISSLEQKGIMLRKWERFEGEPIQRLYSKFIFS